MPDGRQSAGLGWRAVDLGRRTRANQSGPTGARSANSDRDMKGRRLSLPLGRRIVADLSHLSIGSPRAVVLGRIDVGNARDARMHATPRIAWPALFMKAYGLAAREVPE